MGDKLWRCRNCGAITTKNTSVACRFCGAAIQDLYEEKNQSEVDNTEKSTESLSNMEMNIIAGAELMDKSALLNLGTVYAEGLGVGKNKRVAAHLLYSAALKGSGEAMYRYAKLIEADNSEKALWWYVQAAKNGSIQAQNILAERFYNKVVVIPQEEIKSSDGLKSIVNSVIPFCVELTCSSSSKEASRGTGCVIGSNTIITNAHVIMNDSTNQPHKRIMLDFHKSIQSERTEVKVVAYDTKEDIALCVFANVQLSKDLNFPKLGDAHGLECGDKVFTVGNALGRGLALSCGVVSKEVQKGVYGKTEVLQTDMSINGGNSGGALFDYKGDIVGMMTFTPISENTRAYGISFAVTGNTIGTFIQKLIQ